MNEYLLNLDNDLKDKLKQDKLLKSMKRKKAAKRKVIFIISLFSYIIKFFNLFHLSVLNYHK